MVVVSSLLEESRPCREEDLHLGTHALAALVERPTHSMWVLPGVEPGIPEGRFLAPPALPLIWVTDEPRDVFSQLRASIEDPTSGESMSSVFADPEAESAQSQEAVGPWVEVVAARFAELLELRPDWNGHGAGLIAQANILAAGGFLATVMKSNSPAPIIVPTASGGLQLEWHRAGLDVELLFGEEDPPLLYIADLSSGREWEGSPVEGFAEFELAQRLIG